MAIRVRRGVAAILTCVALAFATFGYMQRTASEAAQDAPSAGCKHDKPGKIVDCLILFDD